MKYISIINLFLIAISINSLSSELTSIEFQINENHVDLLNKNEFSFIANYKRNSGYKYLYIYHHNPAGIINYNKAIFKIYFKQFPNKDSIQESNPDYLNSDYSSIEFNSGLFIELSNLKYDLALIFVHSDQICGFRLYYKYENEITFPTYSQYSNFQFNQFILGNSKTETIKYQINNEYNNYLIILSKTSLRNIEVNVKYKGKDATKEKLAYLYPNGCSVFLDYKNMDDMKIELTIKNKNNRNEVLLLGSMHHGEDEIFPNEIVNGFQLYIEGNNNDLNNLLIYGKSEMNQYFTYQIYNKDLSFYFFTADNKYRGTYPLIEYNSMFPYKIDYDGKLSFNFELAPKRSSLYFQYIDYSDIEVAQKSLQSLVTGVPKSMVIPEGKSMYHFLPKERDSTNLYFYLRPKTQEKIYVSFEKCITYPENCVFTKKGENAVESIQNIGLWYNLPRNNSELQLIYVYCEKECAYDILMTYEDDDPLFLFPDNDYSKFISEGGKDIFALPVFEYFETSKTQSLYIDLTVFSGKADLTLKNGRDGTLLKYDGIKAGNKKSFVISSDIFLKDTNYYKKEIYAVVEQDKSYKNTFYNIMYGSGDTNAKILHNNIIYNELLIVPEASKESECTKAYNFTNKEKDDLYISISSQVCKIKVTLDKVAKDASNNHLYKVATGPHKVEIYLVNDGELCISKVEETINIFAYNSDSNVLLSENTLINSTFSNKVSFLHLFKPNEAENSDNSFNMEIERLNDKSVDLTYELKRVSFNGLGNSEISEISSSKINSKKTRYISNRLINKICGSLEQNELCSLTVTLNPTEGSVLSLQLSKNGFNKSKKLADQTLISSVNTKSVQYFYIDVDKNYDTELLINSYGQDLKINYEVKTSLQEDDAVLPLKSSYTSELNSHQIKIPKNQFSKCGPFCRLYIGVCASSDISGTEVSTPFSIGYQFINSGKSARDINLPLNYFAQYTLNEVSEVSFVINPLEKDKFVFELYVIKENENDDSEVTADISGGVKYTLKSSDGKYSADGNAEQINVKVKSSKENSNPTFKFRVSSVGNSLGVIPMISSYPEKCVTGTCYYLLDDLTSDNEEQSVFFYIPESEKAVVNYLELKSDDAITTTGTYTKNTNVMRRSNWLEYPIKDKQHSLIIKVDGGATLCSSFYNKPNKVTLNYGEKRMFSIRKYNLDNILFNIKKPSSSKNKYRINLHAISGNGLFQMQNELYSLGLENAYKEDITIIVDDDKLVNIELIASNEKNGEGDNNADFVFTIEYTIEIKDRLLYEFNYNKINSFKFYRNEKINDIYFYMNIADNASKDLNMNMKIYTNSSTYTVKSYLLKKDFINNKFDDYKTDAGSIKTYIQGGSSTNGELTFSKLEISSTILEGKVKEYPYVCVVFTQKDKKSNVVKIDLYPYDINNSPLAQNELFVQKIPPNTEDYQLLLAKSEFYYKQDVKINFISPLSKKYNLAIAHSTTANEKIRKDENNLIKSNLYDFGQDVITLNSGNVEKKNIAFNIFSSAEKEGNQDHFIFSYKNQLAADEEIYYKNTKSFKVYGTARNITFEVYAVSPKNVTTGNNILIMSAYEKSQVEKLGIEDKYMALYLLFSDIKPVFRKNKVLNLDPTLGIVKTHTTNDIKGGDFYFTAVSIIEDKGREQYLAYEAINKQIEDSNIIGGLLDYMKNHVFATILIIIVIMLFIGIMVNICRAERRVVVVAKASDKEMSPIN